MADLLYNCSSSEHARALFAWYHSFDHGVMRSEYHRVQIEHWLWRALHRDNQRVIDIAQHECPRVWLEISNYYTLGLESSDILGDLCALPISHVDAIICTEVLEHCVDPFRACREMYRALRPQGALYCAAPFCWPDHRRDGEYEDYWRFTEQGWEILLSDFDQLDITPIQWTTEGAQMYDLMRRFECMGFSDDVMMHTGYMVRARKGA